MGSALCPFHVECHFYNNPTKTQSDSVLERLFCGMRYDTCEIARQMLAGKPVPAGACPDGNVRC